MLPSGALTAMRRVQALTFDQTCTIVRSVEVSDGAGGTTNTPTVIATVACRVAPALLQRDEAIIAGQVQGQTPWRVTVPANTDVTEADEIHVGSRIFEVAAVYAPESRETARVCICSERT
jgi:SPP1 family predicted phage head-tail adaptor